MVNARQSIATTLLVVLLVHTPTNAERWSRQLSQAGLVAAPTTNDWVPLNQPCPTCVHSDRTQGAKVLNYGSQNVQPNLIAQSTNNLQYNLVPDTSNRFALPSQGQDSGYGTSYQAVSFHNNHNQQQFQIQHPSSGSSRFSFSSVAAPRPQQTVQRPQFVEQNYQKPAPQPLTQDTNFVNYAQPSYQTFPAAQTQTQTLSPYVSQQKQQVQNSQQQAQQAPQTANGGEEVQLLYVPLDTLYQQQKGSSNYQNERYNALPQPVNAALINDFYSPSLKASPSPSVVTASSYRATTPHQDYYTQPAVTPAPAKPKAHQPPLAMFMRNDKQTVGTGPNDVLTVLRGSSKIDVLDSVDKKSPKVFIGPSALPTPDGYSKYELPYLSSIEPSRLERKAENLPFFVAPLSYKTPPGFSKIPLPEPHVGSVVVNSIEDYEKKEKTYNNPFSVAPQRNTQYQVPSSAPDRQVISLSSNYGFAGRQPSSPAPAFATTPKPRITTYSYDDERPTKGNQYSNSFDSSFKSTLVTRPRTAQTQLTSTTSRPTSVFTTPNFRPPQHFDVDDFFGGSQGQKSKKTNEQGPKLTTTDTTDRFNFKPIPNNFYVQPQSTARPNKYDVFPPVDATVATRPTAINFDNEYSMKQYFKQQSEFKKFEAAKSTYDYPSSTRFPSSTTTRTVAPSSTPKSSAFYESYTTQSEQQKSTPQKTFKFKIVDSVRPNFVDFDDYTRKPSTQRVVSYQPPSTQRAVSYQSPSTQRAVSYQSPSTQRAVSYQPPSTARPEYDNFRSTAPSYVHTYNQEEIVKPIYNQNRYQVAVSTATTPEPPSPSPTLQFNSYEGEYHSTAKQSSSPRYETTTQPSTYHLPSELPAISPSLPGLINSLPDDKWMDKAVPTETTTTEKVTRRPVNRGRRPVTQRTSTTSSYSATESTSRRTIQRGRGTRPTNAPRDSDSPNTRVPATRASGRVKYNPTNEERSRFRTRNRTQNIPKHVDDQKATQETQAQNIDYQRDVLKQNYPTFRPVDTTTAVPVTAGSPSTLMPEVVASIEDQLNIEKLFDIENANNEVVVEPVSEDPKPVSNRKPFDSNEEVKADNVVPVQAALSQYAPSSTSRSIDFNAPNFAGLNEPLKVPKKKQPEEQSENYPAFYSNAEQRNRKLISSRYNSEDVTTTEAATTVKPRRTNLVRRPNNRPTTTPSTETGETVTVRPRIRTSVTEQSSGPVERKVVRVKTRVRRPITTTTESAPVESNARVNYNFRRRGNYNRAEAAQAQKTEADIAEVETAKTSENKPRFRSRNRFVLDTQESQWSPKLSYNSFQPLDAAGSGKSFNDDYSVNGEPDIITAESAGVSSPDSYMVNVSAGLYPQGDDQKKGRSQSDNSISESTVNQITETKQKGTRRRGVWRKVRVHPVDAFETAESQNIGSRYFNSLTAEQSKDLSRTNQDAGAHNKAQSYSFNQEDDEVDSEVITGTPEPSADDLVTTLANLDVTSEVPIDDITTVIPEVERVTEDEVKVTTTTKIPEKEEPTTELPKVEEETVVSETPQPSLFAEMKQKLTDLFALQDDEDDVEEEVTPTATTAKVGEPEFSTQVAFIEEASTGKEEEEVKEAPTTTSATPQFKDPMGSLIFATSTATEISQETEICYRGRCIKTEKTKIKRK